MTFARLLRLASPAAEQEQKNELHSPAAWPYAKSMLLGIPQAEFTASVRRAIWALLGEARNLRRELETTRCLLRRAEQEVDRDHLLPVLNRRAFLRELDRQIDTASRYGTAASLAYIDLDGLKVINDTKGHACGDAVLVQLSSILLSAVRSSDVVGRLGGDEFGLILLHTEENKARATCVRIARVALDKPLVWNAAPVPIRFATGVVQLTDSMRAETALAAADAAMYRQKMLRR